MPEIKSFSQLDPNGYYTYKDYMSWKFQERVELFLGRIFKMSPSPSVRHQQLSRNLMYAFESYFRKNKCQLFSAPFDVRLPVSKKKGKNDTVVQPDILVICDESKLDEQGCNGAPDIVIEILSPGNSHREMKDKFDLYEASFIPEYWIVDPEHEDVVVYSLNEQNQYVGSRPYVSNDILRSSFLEGLEIDLTMVFKK